MIFIKALTIVGARPQFIKAAPVSRELRKDNVEILVHTGQHYDENMSKVFFEELNIPEPDYNLGIGSASHGEQTGKMLIEIEKVIIEENPDVLLVYGDTNSTIAGALAASKLNIPIAHVEAGLRSYNKKMPEEQNRVLTDHLSDILFCPTESSVENLKEEGLKEGIYNVGDVMYDSILYNIDIARKHSNILNDLNMTANGYYLLTIHRAENTDIKNNLITILEATNSLNKEVIFPIHPRTKNKMNEYKKTQSEYKNISFIEPVSYLDMIYLIENSIKVLTDSGGVQKEAYFLKTPCVTLRNETEWIETLENNWNVLCEINKKSIINKTKKDLLNLKRGRKTNFGCGDSAKKIVNTIIEVSKNE